jgi:hypothetical protein
VYQHLSVRIVGDTPFIPHNGQLSDPLNPFSQKIKTISGKRKKVAADYEDMAELEFLGALYMDDGKPCIPAEMLEAVINGGARKSKQGKQASAAVFVKNPGTLEYDGPTDPNALWKNKNFVLRVPVRVQQASVMRTRPIFRKWASTFVVDINTDLAEVRDVLEWIKTAGAEMGVGDWRPQKRGHYGLFVLAGDAA